ncbi:hypothetical protein [[Actinomadura] parvosata]|uniref:hypothetical protein n=1 Tax=[Actinomadura] parvosata TaxID=1955412 RepID=UPI001648C425
MTFPLSPGRRLLAGTALLAAIAATAPVPPATAAASTALRRPAPRGPPTRADASRSRW